MDQNECQNEASLVPQRTMVLHFVFRCLLISLTVQRLKAAKSKWNELGALTLCFSYKAYN